MWPNEPFTVSHVAPSSSQSDRVPSPPRRRNAASTHDPRQRQMAAHAIRQVMPLASNAVSAAIADLPLVASGKVREIYDLGDRLLMVASRPDLHLRRRPSEPDPRQGQGPDGPVGLLVRQDRPHRRQPLRLAPPRACPTRCAAARWSCASSRCCPSSASCAATSPARAGRTTRPPARSRASSCRRACGVRAAADADLHARRRRPRRATTRRSTSTRPPSSSATAS